MCEWFGLGRTILSQVNGFIRGEQVLVMGEQFGHIYYYLTCLSIHVTLLRVYV